MPIGIAGSKRIEMTELQTQSVALDEYDEDTQREYLVSLAHMYKKAKVGDALFKEICQGRAEIAAARGDFFSTCGEFAMFLLERMGYRGPVLNRDIYSATGTQTRSWVSGKNIEYLFMRARREGVFSEYLLSKQKARRPQPGDIVYISDQVNPRSEHVFMLESIDTADGWELWNSIDGGQGGVKTQHIGEVRRGFDQSTGKLAGRYVIGWVNIILLDLVERANLKLPSA